MKYEKEKKQRGRPAGKKLRNDCALSAADDIAVQDDVSPRTVQHNAQYATAVKTITKASGKQAADSLRRGPQVGIKW